MGEWWWGGKEREPPAATTRRPGAGAETVALNPYGETGRDGGAEALRSAVSSAATLAVDPAPPEANADVARGVSLSRIFPEHLLPSRRCRGARGSVAIIVKGGRSSRL
jgi:hypothetical protein